jgi:hypothetical protein
MRIPGYYWVKDKETKQWAIALFVIEKNVNYWNLNGTLLFDDSFEEISLIRLTPPNEWEFSPVTLKPLPGFPHSHTTIPIAEYEECAIAQYFKNNPNAISVNMVCFCKFCTPRC